MGKQLIVITGVIYLVIAVEQWFKGNVGMGMAYLGYAFANVGLYLVAS